MGDIEWKEKYSVGIHRIDYQHRYFAELINWLNKTLPSTGDLELRRLYVKEVVQYAQFHFISEENFMQAIGYDEAEAHTKLHNQLIERLSDHVVRFQFDGEDTPEFMRFLEEWFIEHTVNEDKKIARWYREKTDG